MMLSSLVVCLLCSFFWRVRGGLEFWGHKLPLNKVWFALIYAGAFCYLTDWCFNIFVVLALATFVSYQVYGWGEYLGCLLLGAKPTERSDCDLIDDIVDNLHWGDKYLTDYPYLFGFIGTSLRGLIMTFIIGLAIQNIPYMLSGLGMGVCYGIAGLIARKALNKYDKTGWNIGEYIYGFYLGVALCINTLFF